MPQIAVDIENYFTSRQRFSRGKYRSVPVHKVAQLRSEYIFWTYHYANWRYDNKVMSLAISKVINKKDNEDFVIAVLKELGVLKNDD